jgi:hypothetical protein
MLMDTAEAIYSLEEVSVNFSASLRIFGDALDFAEITRTLGVQPTHQYRKGERRSSRAVPYKHNGWIFRPSLDETRPLTEHILALWVVVRPHVAYLRSLKQTCKVDVFCGYRSNHQAAGFEVDHRCLELFTALEVPFGVSVVTI